MEDISLTPNEKLTRNIQEQLKNQEPKTSIEILREAKPGEDISIKKEIGSEIQSEVTTSNSLQEPIAELTKIETVFEKLDVSSDKADSITDATTINQGKTVENDDCIKTAAKQGNLTGSIINQDRHSKSDSKTTIMLDRSKNLNNDSILKSSSSTKIDIPQSAPKSEIFPTGEVHNNQNLYSVNGSPSGRINRRRDLASNVFPVGCMGCKEETTEGGLSPRRFLDATEAATNHVGHIDSTPRKRPSSTKSDVRNPLTGAGMEINDIRRQPFRRKDGNPVLGEGYENSKPLQSTNSGRVPPGGYSKGLW